MSSFSSNKLKLLLTIYFVLTDYTSPVTDLENKEVSQGKAKVKT